MKAFERALDEAMMVVGSENQKTFFAYLAREFALKKNRVLHDLDKFAEALEKFFGDMGHVIEKILVKELHFQLGVEYLEREGGSLNEQVNRLLEGSDASPSITTA